jgi:chromosome segregation protein
MYVKALRLAGFKSFADPTRLEFEPGVNVIVGPNGSGKSNIADALSWVLGSQAPSSLRGGSMEDVIFAGAQGRPRLGFAEVELTLDNSSGVLALDLSEVTIARSTDRNGESEYKINGAPCRLLDITELLSDTGIGRSIHTVVGQGQLDDVLQARPEDRRAFIEEAAQIGKFRRRKDRALRKIERVDENLLRLNDVLSELRRAIRPLKRQASAASLYSELVGSHRELKQRLAATEIHKLVADRGAADVEAETRRAGLLADELANVRARLEGAVIEKDRLARDSETAQDVAHGIARAADRLASLGRLAGERAARIGTRLAVETEEGYRERIRILESDKVRWTRQTEELRAAAAAARQESETSVRQVQSHREDVERAEAKLSDARAEETAAAQALVRAEGSEAAGRATVDSIKARVHAVVERREVLGRQRTTDEHAIKAAEGEVEALERELDSVTEAAAAAEMKLEAERTRADELKDRLATSHASKAAADARLEVLREISELFVGTPDVTARIAPLISDSEERVRMANSGEDGARQMVDAAEASIELRWSEVAKLDEELRRLDALMSAATERLSGAHRQHESREIELAALDDEIARAKDALATAERDAIEERAALPAHKAALDEMRSARVEAEQGLRTARSAFATITGKAAEIGLEARSADERALAAQLRLEEAEAGIADTQRALEGLEDMRASLRAARERAERISDVASRWSARGQIWAREADTRAVDARQAARDAERRLTEMRTRERDLAQNLEEVGRRRNQAEVRQAQVDARMQSISERAMDEWAMSIDALGALEAFDEDGEAAAHKEAEKLEREIRRLGVVNPNAAEEYAELAERDQFLERQMEDLRSSRRDLMKVVREVDDTIIEVFGQAYESVANEFNAVFSRLFPGGEGRLVLTDPTDLLATGIDIEARPPGKNVKKLSLLSGGERSLVALAFLFSIFRSRPSPFYLLDEVEAALDDVNLQRFLGLIDELEEHAQVLIVTHQKRTMEAADVLYGVSMAKDGVSAVVAKRLEERPFGDEIRLPA